MSIREIVGVGIMGIAGITVSILGLVIHVWTIVIAFSVSGLLAAVLTLVFPVVSEIFWFIDIGSNLGFDTTYCVSIIAYVALFGIMILGGVMVESNGD